MMAPVSLFRTPRLFMKGMSLCLYPNPAYFPQTQPIAARGSSSIYTEIHYEHRTTVFVCIHVVPRCSPAGGLRALLTVKRRALVLHRVRR